MVLHCCCCVPLQVCCAPAAAACAAWWCIELLLPLATGPGVGCAAFEEELGDGCDGCWVALGGGGALYCGGQMPIDRGITSWFESLLVHDLATIELCEAFPLLAAVV